MADKYAHEGKRTLWQYGFAIRADNTTPYATSFEGRDENGRADWLVARNGRAFYIEVKYAKTAYRFNQWRENQRQWYEAYCKPSPYNMELWFLLFMGYQPPHYNPDKYKYPRKAWLFPAEKMIEVEAIVLPIQGALPYRASSGMRKQIQQNQYDAVTMLSEFALEWSGNGTWAIPKGHILSKIYLMETETANEPQQYKAV